MAVESFSFDHVNDIELVYLLAASVAHLEEEPLTVDTGAIMVELELQIILIFVSFPYYLKLGLTFALLAGGFQTQNVIQRLELCQRS